MKLLSVQSSLEGDCSSLNITLIIVATMWLFVFARIAIEIKSKYMKVKIRDKARTSFGLKRTISERNLYYIVLFLPLYLVLQQPLL